MPNAAPTSACATRYAQTASKPFVVKLSRKLSVTYWPQRRRSTVSRDMGHRDTFGARQYRLRLAVGTRLKMESSRHDRTLPEM